MTPTGRIARLYRAIDFIRNLLVVVLFGFIVVSMGFQIALRTLEWTDEILRYINIWVIFLGSSIAVKRGAHLQMDFFVEKLFSGKKIRIVRAVRHLVIIAALLVIGVVGAVKTLKSIEVQTQMVENLSVAWFYAAVPVGCLLMAWEYGVILLWGEQAFGQREPVVEDSTC